MDDPLPEALRAELAAAQRRKARRATRLRVRVGGETYPILRLAEAGFSLDAQDAPNLRGLVDIYDGGRHLYECLVVYSALEGDVMSYEFKRSTAARTAPPRDFRPDEEPPAGLLPRY